MEMMMKGRMSLVALSLGLMGLVGCSSSSTLPPAAAIAQPPAPLADARSAPLATSPAVGAHDLKVMTFNLRVATIFDLWNTWDIRKGQVLDHIRKFNPDMLGTQEGLNGMEKFLRAQLSDYTFYGVGRNDGKTSGEMVGVFYKTDKFDRIDGGNFWLSPNPQHVGSRGWGEWFPRMVTWVELRPRDGGQPFCWFNTHFAAFASHARTESARLLQTEISNIAGNMPCIVTGDFNANADPQTAAYAVLTATHPLLGEALTDAFRATHPVRVRDEGTRHDFNGHRDGDRIDWILSNPAFQAVSVTIDRGRGLLGYPSDHFPVEAVLRPVTVTAPALARNG